jgi:uncharacterized protein YwqG
MNDPLATNFGMNVLGAPGEVWPMANARPMLFVCQLNLTGAPFVPPLLKDIQLITFFADLEAGTMAHENGTDWRLFAYPSLEGLSPMARPAGAPSLHKRFECKWEVADDHPTSDDPARIVPKGFDDSEVELDNQARTKIGGYASTIQSENWWHIQDHPARPEYAFQINSEEKAALMFGDSGCLYLARGTSEGFTTNWFLDFQCF